jgi:amino acid adenylation domain-containing protein
VSDTSTVLRAPTAEAAAGFPCDLVRAHATANGDRTALVDLNGSAAPVSYAGLMERVDTLAARLRDHGVGPEQPVAVLLDRSIDGVVAMLAVLVAGGVYSPLDPAAPGRRTAAMLRALGARIAVADGVGPAWFPPGTTVVTPAERAPARPVSRPAPGAAPAPDALAYVLFTSGSTGVPKGVAMTRRGLDRLIRWQIADGPPGLRTLQFTAASFDVTFQEVLSTLATGGCLVIGSEAVRRDPAVLLDTIVEQGIERLFLPYVALQLMAVTAGRRSLVPASLRHVVTAGERLIITPAIRDLFTAIPHCRLDNHYGPTEAHLVTSLTLPNDRMRWPSVPAIGAPVDGVSCRVLDERLQPCPAGEVGELYVGGSGLARGYLGATARTAERFVAKPFAGEPGGRLYRTGDLVRESGDGTYEFVGRIDTQLKVRGYRVEPAEVEHALLRHPRVDAAAVGMRDIADGVSVLVGYLQTAAPVSSREIADHLREWLPAYMVPTRYVEVPALPRTATGKVDAKALAELELPAAAESSAAAPSTVDVVKAIWARVLGHDEFDVDDDFFDVGGDSLLATWVVAELGQTLGRPVELAVFLEYSTVEDLAGRLASAVPVSEQRPRSSQIVTLRPGPSGRSLYLLHPLGGELLGYRELARASRAPVRILGISWTGPSPAFGTPLSEIARTHVAQLRAVQPDGPYMLAGWSFGGVLAYEMGRQLIDAGAEVPFLGLLDANPVIDPITGLPMAETPFLAALDAVVARLDDPAATEADLVELTSRDTWLRLMGSPITAGSSRGYLRGVLDTARACMWAAMHYQPGLYPGPIHLFQAGGSGADRQAELAAVIRGLSTGECTVVSAPGDHWGFIRSEHVAATAAALDVALERTGAAGSGTDGS